MADEKAEYQRKTRKLCNHLDKTIYEILSEEPSLEWELSEIQDRIAKQWGIKPYRATILRHTFKFYQKHLIPLFVKTGFTKDKYKMDTSINSGEWQKVFSPPPKGRPRKVPSGTRPPSLEPEVRQEYDTRYRRTRRNLHKHVLKLFEDQTQGTSLTTNEIIDHIRDETGFRFSEKIIQHEIQNYNNCKGPPYINEIEAGTYYRGKKDI